MTTPTEAPADEQAPLSVAELPAYWDARRERDGKPDKSRCAADLRRALAALDGTPPALAELLADMRAESSTGRHYAERIEAALGLPKGGAT